MLITIDLWNHKMLVYWATFGRLTPRSRMNRNAYSLLIPDKAVSNDNIYLDTEAFLDCYFVVP